MSKSFQTNLWDSSMYALASAGGYAISQQLTPTIVGWFTPSAAQQTAAQALAGAGAGGLAATGAAAWAPAIQYGLANGFSKLIMNALKRSA